MTFRSFAALALISLLTPAIRADEPPPIVVRGVPYPRATSGRSPAPTATADVITPAEEINRLQRAVESEEKQLRGLTADRDDPKGEYPRAKAAFERTDKALQERKQALEKLQPGDLAGRRDISAQVKTLSKQWDLAKNRFDLAIEARRAAAEQIATLERMRKRDRQGLDRLQSTAPSAEDSETVPAPDAAVGSAVPAVGKVGVGVASPAIPATPATATPAGAIASPATATAPTAPVQPAAAPSQELLAAEKEVRRKIAAEKAADAAARTATEQLGELDKDIALEKKLLVTARKQRDNASQARDVLTANFRERSVAGAPKAELDGILDQVKRAERRLDTATAETQKHTLGLEEIQTERAGLQAEQLTDLHKAEEARKQAQTAENAVRRIENPFRPHNVLLWLVDHGPKMLAVLLAMLIARWFSRHFCERVIWLIAQKGARGSSVEREDRARTLVGVFYNAASIAILLGGSLMVLQEAGIPVAPLLGGAAVFGLAVAFGAQNLIRDYFYGFVVLMENQYKLNDVVQIGALSGQVEKITLRMTVLRDLEGRVHFIPNGQVTAVTNMTHGWSRALFDIGVAYKEDVDHVMGVLATLANELRADPQFGPLTLEDAIMLGVDSLDDSAVVIKFYIKTRPLQQWTIRREMLRRIKNRFDELGIEIPFPHRTVYHRTDSGSGVIESMGTTPRIAYGSGTHS